MVITYGHNLIVTELLTDLQTVTELHADLQTVVTIFGNSRYGHLTWLPYMVTSL